MKWAEMGWNMHRLEKYSRRECIESAGIPSSITNDLLEEHVLLIFEKLAVLLGAMDIVDCHRLEKTNRVIVKLLNRKDAQYIFEEKYKLANSVTWLRWERKKQQKYENFQCRSPYSCYRKLYDLLKDLNNEDLIHFGYLMATSK